ncbi:MAG: DUF2089 family protein [Anaerolineae bacterium]
MITTRLYCPECDTTIEGRFVMGRLGRLTPEQVYFVETFLRCEGTIKRVEKELNISYPTVRARLKEVIRAMGFEVISDYFDEAPTLTNEERRSILDRLDRGEISTEEALELLRSHQM